VGTSALVRSVVDTARRSPGWPRRPWVSDLAVVLVFGILAAFGTMQAVQEGGNGQRPLDPLGWGLVAVATVALAARRQRPALVVLVTSAAIAVSVALGYPTGPIWATPLIAIQAGVADEALTGCQACPEPAQQAVRAIRAASREAMAELKATVTMLREGAAPRGPLPGLDQLEELVGVARSAGVRVELAVSGAARPRQDAREPGHEQARRARPRPTGGARLRAGLVRPGWL
jgi:hypothetical protein